jgi:flavin reductase (DIM6/NTAB) family NADH-FMN oxidoreductase RutF
MKQISLDELTVNPFTFFSHPAVAVVSAKDKTNALTISWGALGTLWNKSCVFVFIRDSRYSHALFEKGAFYSVCFLDKEHNEKARYLGKASGKTEDKIKGSGLTLAYEDGVPYFAESDLVIIAKKLVSAILPSDDIADKEVYDKYYPEGGYHTVYPGEIVKILKK